MRAGKCSFLIRCSVHSFEAHKNEVTKQTVAVLLLWVTGEKATRSLGDSSGCWLKESALRPTCNTGAICVLLAVMTSTGGSPCREGNASSCLMCPRARFRCLLSRPCSTASAPPLVGSSPFWVELGRTQRPGASRGSSRHTGAQKRGDSCTRSPRAPRNAAVLPGLHRAC